MAKYYRFDYKGNILADKTFDEIHTVSNVFPEYSTVRKGKKWGLVKSDAYEIVIEIKYDRISIERFDFPLVLAWENGKVILLDIQNNILVPAKYDYLNIINGDDRKYSDQGYAVTTLNKGKGLINLNGSEIFPPEYLDCNILPANRFLLKNEYGFLLADINGNVIKKIEAEHLSYRDSIFHFKNNGKVGYWDIDFNVLIENNYDDIKVINENLFFARNNNESVVLDRKGKIIKKFDFPFVLYSFLKNKMGEYNYVVAKDSSYQAKQGLLNNDFELVIPIECNWLEYNEEVWVVKIGRSDHLYGMDFKEIKGVKYKEIGRFETAGISCTVDEEGKYRFINYKGEIINELIFDRVYLGSHSTLDRLFSQGLLGVRINGKWGFIDDTGKIVIDFIYDEVTQFDSNRNSIVKKNGKWGLINSNGDIVLDFLYDSILDYDFKHKVIKSKKDNLFGLIDFDNQIIIPHLADSLWLKDGFVDVQSKKSVFQKPKTEKKTATASIDKVKPKKSAEPIQLLEKKFVKSFDSLKHPEIVRAMVLSVAEEPIDGFFKIYIIDFVKRDGSTATYINGYAGGGEWESYEFNDEVIYEGGNDGISAFHLSQDDKSIHAILKDYLCEFDEDADEYRYHNLDHFEKTETENLIVLNSVWYDKNFDFSEISKNDKKRFKNLLKQTGLLWKKWNFKF